MHSYKATAASSNVDDDVPMIESFYDDGEDLSSRFIATGITQQAIPSLKAKFENKHKQIRGDLWVLIINIFLR